MQPLIELALGLYFTATVFYALANQIYGTVPFLVLFQIGFLYTGLLSIVQQYAGDSDVVTAGLGAGPSGFMKARVAVLRVTPDTILSDIDRLVELGGVSTRPRAAARRRS